MDTRSVAESIPEPVRVQAENPLAAAPELPTSTPLDLEERLCELGLTAYEDPPLEPSYAATALVNPLHGTTVDGVAPARSRATRSWRRRPRSRLR